MKLYTFVDEDGKVIEEVRAENIDQAFRISSENVVSSSDELPYGTDFYSTELDD